MTEKGAVSYITILQFIATSAHIARVQDRDTIIKDNICRIGQNITHDGLRRYWYYLRGRSWLPDSRNGYHAHIYTLIKIISPPETPHLQKYFASFFAGSIRLPTSMPAILIQRSAFYFSFANSTDVLSLLFSHFSISLFRLLSARRAFHSRRSECIFDVDDAWHFFFCAELQNSGYTFSLSYTADYRHFRLSIIIFRDYIHIMYAMAAAHANARHWLAYFKQPFHAGCEIRYITLPRDSLFLSRNIEKTKIDIRFGRIFFFINDDYWKIDDIILHYIQ